MIPRPRPLVIPPPPAAPPVVAPLLAFPAALAHRLALTTSSDLLDDVRIDRATDGTGRARSFYLAPKQAIGAVLPGLSEPEWATLDAFYRSSRAVPFTIPWGPCGAEVPLSVLFASPPKRTFHGGGNSSVAFALQEFP